MNFSPTELYIFCICFIVFAALTILLAALIATVFRYYMRLVKLGAEDQKIRKEYDNRHRQSKFLNALGNIINVAILIVLVIAFIFSVSIKICERQRCDAVDMGALHIVRSNSMSKAYEKNEYLFKHGFDGEESHFRLFDMIYTQAMPPEEDLQLYDVVVYQLDDILVVHRIIKIEEPNKSHPNERYYYLRGDNSNVTDPKPVTYSQMRGIWQGQKIEHVGSFILFMQSPAGYLCIILMLFTVFVMPAVLNRIEKARKLRYKAITGIDIIAEERAEKELRSNREIQTYYNRPGSPYSAPKQRQNETVPYAATNPAEVAKMQALVSHYINNKK